MIPSHRYNTQSFNSRRSPVLARGGMVAASQPLAAQAGLQTLLRGGNAFDAAVTVSAVLGVTEPHQTGLGGDAFALLYLADSGRVRALNASGAAPMAARLEDYRAQGLTEVPRHSPLAWTVPGCVDGWQQLIEAHGRLSLTAVLEPAIEYAEAGFPISPVDALAWQSAEELLRQDPGSTRALLIDGRAPRAGEVLRQPDLARSLRAVAIGGSDAFYRGEIAERIAEFSRAAGGLLMRDDLAAYHATWEEPIEITYRGRRVLECPPNGQGLAALIALRALEHMNLRDLARESPECWHLLIEATKQGLLDAMACVADPRFEDVPVEALLSQATEKAARAAPARQRATNVPETVRTDYSHTVYMAVVDRWGNAASFISSIYDDFGTGLTIDGLGFPLQNRGACFSLDPGHPNRLAPGKRPYHTIIPGLLMQGTKLLGPFGVMGGFMQPQGHLQLLVNLLDYEMDVQTAIDSPRFQWLHGNTVNVEDGLPDETYRVLESWGHDVRRTAHRGFGGAQAVLIDPDTDVRIAGSEPRQDGCALGY